MKACWLTTIALACGACGTRSATIGAGYTTLLETLSDPPTKLDILFVVDDSGSMADDQRALVEAARTELFGQLVTQAGTPPDLHVAVVSTSVTVGGDSGGFEGCSSGLPDGRFLLGPWLFPDQACAGITGSFLVDTDDGMGGRSTNFTGTIEDNFACIAMLGDAGCGIEQPLEAMRQALSGEHAENAGFLRDDAMLLVVFLSDEDDSSGTDPTVWPSTDPYVANVREFEYGVVCTPDDDSLGPRTGCLPRDGTAAVHPISEYVDFLGLVKSDPSITMVAGITSPPGPVTVIDTMGNPGAGTLDLEGACTPPPGPCADNPLMTCARKPALPAVRLDAFMTQFPARYALASICDQTMLARVHQISRAVSGVMTNRPCLIGDVTTAMLAPDRCRAFDVDASGSRSEIGATISEDATMCDYTTSHLRADIPEVAMGHHVVFECLK